MNKNTIEYGISNVYYSVVNYDQESNVTTYGKPKVLKGATGLSLELIGETATIYADNVPYYVGSSNQGYSGSLTITSPNSEFLSEVFNLLVDQNQANIEYSNNSANEIAIGFQVDGDQEKRRIWLYRVAIARPVQEHKTKGETIEADISTFNLKILPRQDDSAIKAFINEKSSPEIYSNWFGDVYQANTTPETK